MSQRRVVMKDIAERAGVHQTTVSMALRNDPRIKKETRDRILKLAKDMGYSPDPLLSSLISYRRNRKESVYHETIALIFDIKLEEFRGDYFCLIKDAVCQCAAEFGYKVEVFVKDRDFKDIKMLNRVLRTRSIHGIVFATLFLEVDAHDLEWDQFSIIKISQTPYELNVDSVMGNYSQVVREALRELRKLGFKRPAMAGSYVAESNTRNAYAEGFLYGQYKHFDKENHIAYYEFDGQGKDNEQINNEIYQWLREVKPDVLLSYWNNLFVSAYRLTTEDHHSCHFIPLAGDQDMTRAIGGMQKNFSQMARTATELLIGKLQRNDRGIPEHSTMTLVDAKWVNPGKWPPETPESFF